MNAGTESTGNHGYQEVVAAWHTSRFPDATAADIALKASSEMGEVCDAVLAVELGGKGDVVAECADVLITLFALVGRYRPAADLLEAVDRKLAVLSR